MSRAALLPLVPLYGAAAWAKNLSYDRGWIKPRQLRWPVVSVGNLSVGGSGKTPLVIRLGELLREHGIAVDVLSRGYRRDGLETERVDPSGTAERFGDEPLLIARRTGLPVFVGASRYAAARLAEDSLGVIGPAVHLLDDGFQHRKLVRSVDIVVVHRSDFEEKLLPAGRLREPLSSLARATFVVLREEDAEWESRVRRLAPAAGIWWVRRKVELPLELPERAVVFCGIARPAEFFDALRSSGLALAGTAAFPDHHRYTQEDMRRLAVMAAEGKASAFVTTEKDEVKLNGPLRSHLERVAPVLIVRLRIELRDEQAAVEEILRLTWRRLP